MQKMEKMCGFLSEAPVLQHWMSLSNEYSFCIFIQNSVWLLNEITSINVKSQSWKNIAGKQALDYEKIHCMLSNTGYDLQTSLISAGHAIKPSFSNLSNNPSPMLSKEVALISFHGKGAFQSICRSAWENKYAIYLFSGQHTCIYEAVNRGSWVTVSTALPRISDDVVSCLLCTMSKFASNF